MASTSYPANAGDWRGVFIRNITYALARREDIALRAWCPHGEMPAQAEYVASDSDRAWFDRLTRSGGIAHAIRQGRFAAVVRPLQLLGRLRALYRRERSIDIVHANWLQTALPLPKDGRPLLVTVLGTDFDLLRIPGLRSLLRRVFRSRRTVICPNADWMLDDLRRYFGDVAEVQCIPFGIDGAYYDLTRSPTDTGNWICVSRVTRAKIGDLFIWGERFFKGGMRTLHLFGPMQEPVAIPEWVTYHGPASQADLLGRWFPSATGLISLSRHAEGRPQVMLEAMAAGLPIVASDMPAHRSLIEPSAAGRVCAGTQEFGSALAELEDPEVNSIVGRNGRRFSMERFGTWDTCADRYAALYRKIAMGPGNPTL